MSLLAPLAIVKKRSIPQDAPPRGLRADIQALRAIAVLLVIADHMGILQRVPGGIHGGFLGVDIFFVISGFLITSHLLKELTTTGALSFAKFYARRARRILPAAALVLLVASCAAWVVFWPNRAISSTIDAIWALFLMSNINFARAGTDYFADGQVSLFQHYWSLSVEEQFYLLWPLLMMLTFLLARKKKISSYRAAAVAVAVVGTASLAWACFATIASPAASYFSTPARAFEFAAGALVAVAAPRLNRQNLFMPLRYALSFSGLAIIAVSVVVIDPDSAVPGPWALLPVVGATAFIVAGTGVPGGVALPILRSRLIGYFGSLSYSLYLWHWPVIVLTAAIMPTGNFWYLGIVSLSTALLSVVTYHFVEEVFRYRKQEPKTSAVSRRHVLIRRGVRPLALVSLGLAAVVGLTTTTVALATPPPTVAASDVVKLKSEDESAPTKERLVQIQNDMHVAIENNSWAGLEPAVDGPAESEPPGLADECWNDRTETRDKCVLGDPHAKNSMVILGDSIAMNWAPALSEVAMSEPEWNLVVLAKVGCPYADLTVYDTDRSTYEGCDDFRAWALDQINTMDPDAVVLASALKKELPGTEPLESQWGIGVSRTIQALGNLEQVFVMAPPPEGDNLSSCANKFSSPADCASLVSPTWEKTVKVTSVVARDQGRMFINTGLWFCQPSGYCPPVIGNHVVRKDSVHMTHQYVEYLKPMLRAWLFTKSS